MDIFKVVLVILVIFLGAATFIFFAKAQVASAQLEKAQNLAAATQEFLRVQGASCGAGKTDFDGTTECIKPLLLQKDFKQDAFGQPDEKKGTQGYLVIKNINRQAYAAANFTFMYNREVLAHGCHIDGDIGYNAVCRFNFNTRCIDGDLLEVEYLKGAESAKVFTMSC
jgi:hypothetical protein